MPTYIVDDGKTKTEHEAESEYDAVDQRYRKNYQSPWMRYSEDGLRIIDGKRRDVMMLDVKIDGAEFLVDVYKKGE